MAGVLEGLRLIEMAGLGPGPFAAMMLADHGAEVLRIERMGGSAAPIGKPDAPDFMLRGRSTMQVDLKSSAGRDVVIELARKADGLIEGFRPGVMERLGLGPDVMLEGNPAFVFGRMTGWGQDGPASRRVGHDINYLALSGTLHMLGRMGEQPTPPLNLVADYGGGGMMLAFGMCAALLQATRSGKGQVVDCAMIDGAALLATMVWSFAAQDLWRDERGVNMLDTGAPFYDTYECADGRYLAVGAIEPPFYRRLLELLGQADDAIMQPQFDDEAWPTMKARLAANFATRPRDEWCDLLEDTDACVTPVLSMAEAPRHPHNRARELFVEDRGGTRPAAAPRFSAHPATPRSETGGADLVQGFGLARKDVEALSRAGIIAFG